MSENYADLGFPGMLAGVFMIGLFVAAACRYFMAVPLPWLVREGIVLAFIYAIAATAWKSRCPSFWARRS